MQRKKLIGRVVFFSWVVLFLVHYVVGSQGLLYGWRMKSENDALKQEIAGLECAVTQVRTEIGHFKNEPFFKEQLARQQLQLARAGETVYYVS